MALPDDLNMTDTQLIRLCRKQDAEIARLRSALASLLVLAEAKPCKLSPEETASICRFVLERGTVEHPINPITAEIDRLVARREAIADEQSVPAKCVECGVNYADLPSRLCPGCESYRDHQR